MKDFSKRLFTSCASLLGFEVENRFLMGLNFFFGPSPSLFKSFKSGLGTSLHFWKRCVRSDKELSHHAWNHPVGIHYQQQGFICKIISAYYQASTSAISTSNYIVYAWKQQTT